MPALQLRVRGGRRRGGVTGRLRLRLLLRKEDLLLLLAALQPLPTRARKDLDLLLGGLGLLLATLELLRKELLLVTSVLQQRALRLELVLPWWSRGGLSRRGGATAGKEALIRRLESFSTCCWTS